MRKQTYLRRLRKSLTGIPVREKESLAYSIKSMYVKQKANIFIRAGIEIPNFEKAVNLIKEQLEIMKKGEFSEEDLQSAKEYVKARN